MVQWPQAARPDFATWRVSPRQATRPWRWKPAITSSLENLRVCYAPVRQGFRPRNRSTRRILSNAHAHDLRLAAKCICICKYAPRNPTVAPRSMGDQRLSQFPPTPHFELRRQIAGQLLSGRDARCDDDVTSHLSSSMEQTFNPGVCSSRHHAFLLKSRASHRSTHEHFLHHRRHRRRRRGCRLPRSAYLNRQFDKALT
jgi:hypothetical protein